MNLSEIREQFVKESGRYDLINDDGSDNGADFYINAGQKYLDALTEKTEEIARAFRVIDSGDYFVRLQGCRAIHDVGVGNSESFNWIERYDLYDLRKLYNEPFGFIESATPSHFAPAKLRPANPDSDDFDGIVGYMDVISDWKNFNGIVLLPPADGQYHIEVWGKFYSDELVNDDDESYWSARFGHILVMAAQRSLETFYRNSQGINDWNIAIRSELVGLEQDYVEELYYGINQIEG